MLMLYYYICIYVNVVGGGGEGERNSVGTLTFVRRIIELKMY